MSKLIQRGIMLSGEVYGRLFAELNLYVIVQRGGEFVPGEGRVDREMRMTAVDEYRRLYFLYFDAKEWLQPVRKSSAGVEDVVHQHDTFFFECLQIAIDRYVALLGSKFIECNLYQL